MEINIEVSSDSNATMHILRHHYGARKPICAAGLRRNMVTVLTCTVIWLRYLQSKWCPPTWNCTPSLPRKRGVTDTIAAGICQWTPSKWTEFRARIPPYYSRRPPFYAPPASHLRNMRPARNSVLRRRLNAF